MCTYFDQGGCHDVSNQDISLGFKAAATALCNPTIKGTPIARVDTHSICSGGANALSLLGYVDRQIKKMGRWRGATFLEYISDEIATFSKGMSWDMSQQFGFTNIVGGAYTNVG